MTKVGSHNPLPPGIHSIFLLPLSMWCNHHKAGPLIYLKAFHMTVLVWIISSLHYHALYLVYVLLPYHIVIVLLATWLVDHLTV